MITMVAVFSLAAAVAAAAACWSWRSVGGAGGAGGAGGGAPWQWRRRWGPTAWQLTGLKAARVAAAVAAAQ